VGIGHVEVTDILLPENRVQLDFFINHGFDLRKDFKLLRKLNLSDQYPTLMRCLPVEFILQYEKSILVTKKNLIIVKLRCRDESRNASKSSGFRILCLALVDIDRAKVIPFHIYTHVGSAGRKDISDDQKKNCIRMLDEIR
jgi:hypothetical protein